MPTGSQVITNFAPNNVNLILNHLQAKNEIAYNYTSMLPYNKSQSVNCKMYSNYERLFDKLHSLYKL